MMIQWGRVITQVPEVTLDGRYVASWRMGRLVIAELPESVGPGVAASHEAMALAIPVVSIVFNDMGSVNAIRRWLNAIEHSIGPKWVYKEGD